MISLKFGDASENGGFLFKRLQELNDKANDRSEFLQVEEIDSRIGLVWSTTAGERMQSELL